MSNPIETLSEVISGFDYRVDATDFVLYELARLIEEERATFEDEEFRRLIDEGIRQHIDERLELRAALAGRFRRALPALDSRSQVVAGRVIRALEDSESDLRNVAVIVGTYTAYLFDRLENMQPAEEDSRIAEAADSLLDESVDAATADRAIEFLGAVPSLIAARVLAHAISEPMLEERLEDKAYNALKSMWPLPRNYMLYVLGLHTHLDLPYRWFQLLVEAGEVLAVDLILEECRMHGNSATFQEDLAALIELMLKSYDPEVEAKVLEALNDPETPKQLASMLETFLKAYVPPQPSPDNPWSRRDRLREINKRYVAAAERNDHSALKQILKEEPDYPLAKMLLEG